MTKDEVELAVLRLAKACNLLAGAVREVEARRTGQTVGGLLGYDLEGAVTAAQREISFVVDLVEGRGNGRA